MGHGSGGDRDKVQDTAKNNNPPELETLPTGTKTKNRAGPGYHRPHPEVVTRPPHVTCSGSQDWLLPAWCCRFPLSAVSYPWEIAEGPVRPEPVSFLAPARSPVPPRGAGTWSGRCARRAQPPET